MKLLINSIILAGLLLFYSCDNRDIYVEPLNIAPEISFAGSGTDKTVFTDSVKLSLKNKGKFSEFQITFSDKNQNLKEVKFELEGAGKLFQDDKETGADLNISGGKNQMRFEPSALGLHKLRFTAKDKADKKSTATASIYAFSNFTPDAKIKINSVKVQSVYEYELDASGSFDRDEKWGGGIVSYTFFINDRKIAETRSAKIKYIFPEAGNYNLRVIVKDQEGTTSTDAKQGVVIQ
jgi:hypothetical protein